MKVNSPFEHILGQELAQRKSGEAKHANLGRNLILVLVTFGQDISISAFMSG